MPHDIQLEVSRNKLMVTLRYADSPRYQETFYRGINGAADVLKWISDCGVSHICGEDVETINNAMLWLDSIDRPSWEVV